GSGLGLAALGAALAVAPSPAPGRAVELGDSGAACAPWRAVLPQDLPGLDLTGVAAVNPTLAWAVGSFYGEAPPKILRWDGTAWADQRVRLPMEGELNGVTAISATDAWAIGYGNNIDPLAVHWDG